MKAVTVKKVTRKWKAANINIKKEKKNKEKKKTYLIAMITVNSK